MKYQFRSRSYPYGRNRSKQLTLGSVIREIIGLACLLVIAGVLIAVAGLWYQPLGI